MSLSKAADLSQEPNFIKRVRAGIVFTAQAIATEAATTKAAVDNKRGE